MINRYYICDACSFSFCIKQEMNDKLKKRCPACRKHKLYQDLTGQHIYCHNITTLGQQGRKNWKKLGHYEKEHVVRKEKQEAINRKYRPALQQGLITPDQVPSVDYQNPYELPKDVKKKIFKGTKQERQKNIDNYIRNGT